MKAQSQNSETQFTSGDAIFFSVVTAVVTFIVIVGYRLSTSGADIFGLVD